MSSNILIVKNMVCQRCVISVQDILTSLAIPFHEVTVGEIHPCHKIEAQQRIVLQEVS